MINQKNYKSLATIYEVTTLKWKAIMNLETKLHKKIKKIPTIDKCIVIEQQTKTEAQQQTILSLFSN